MKKTSISLLVLSLFTVNTANADILINDDLNYNQVDLTSSPEKMAKNTVQSTNLNSKKEKQSTNRVDKNNKDKNSSKVNENTIIINDIKAVGINKSNGNVIFKALDLNVGDSYLNTTENNKNTAEKLLSTGYFSSTDVKVDDNNLILILQENPIIGEIKVNGNKAIKSRAILGNLNQIGIASENVFNPVILNNFKNNLLNEYQSMGRQQAKIDFKFEDSLKNPEQVDILINIEENPSVKINKINFIGNHVYSNEKLSKLMKLSNKGFLPFTTDNLDQNKLRNDLENIVSFYHENGYFDAGTQDVQFTQVNNNPFNQDVNIYINEGEIYKFSKPKANLDDISLIDTVLPIDKLESLIVIKDGAIYKRSDVYNTVQNIQNYLADSGYAFAKVDVDVKKLEQNQVEFDFLIYANNKVKINNVHVSGNEKTKDYVITREMRQKVGEDFNLKKMQRTKERLDLTGYFNEVKLETSQVKNSDNAINPDLVDINIAVDERRTGVIQGQVGYMQDYGVTFGVGAEDRNFMGYGKSLGGNFNYNKVQKGVDFTYKDPFFTQSGISLDVNSFGYVYDPTKQDDNYQSYKTTKYGTGFTFGFPINEYDRIYSGLNFEHLKVNTYENAPQQYRKFINEYGDVNGDTGEFSGWLYKANIGWGRNTTNHAYWPTKGYITNINGQFTLPFSKLNYYKVDYTHKQFFPIGDESSIMLSGRLGYANSYGKTKDLPFFENYYGGGLGFVRGFESGTLGPKVYDRNNSVVTYGGNKIAGLSAEFQTPVPFIKDSSNVRLSAFVDAGTVFDGNTYTHKDSDNGVSIYGDKEHHSTFKNEFRASAGLAWTWISPIGPVKFSYAYPIKKKPEDQIQRFQFQLGTTF